VLAFTAHQIGSCWFAESKGVQYKKRRDSYMNGIDGNLGHARRIDTSIRTM